MYGTERGNNEKGYSLFDFMVLKDSLDVTAARFSAKSPVASKSPLSIINNRICINIVSGTSVKLHLVDFRGKLVDVLIDGFRSAGKYETVLPGNLAQGVYILRLIEGTGKKTSLQIRL